MGVTRRASLLALAGSALMLFDGAVTRVHKFRQSKGATLDARFNDPSAAIRFGVVCRATAFGCSAAARAKGAKLGAALGNAEIDWRGVQQFIRQDFADGRTVSVQGWLLSETEVSLLANLADQADVI